MAGRGVIVHAEQREIRKGPRAGAFRRWRVQPFLAEFIQYDTVPLRSHALAGLVHHMRCSQNKTFGDKEP
ncbi:hypothetical protein B0I32_115313 [Nonomuraea fuscirosea]|uniref:Uncharacterized protein n=1 Tax=Nonomuraea fuscirosea TaxID=1291556 RepID=A0A2T0MSJ0_9ACTN|nr:hypothetical protein B0I32_115313 [Nonomuraea fuscirosea]